MDDVKRQPDEFQKLLAESQAAGRELETALRYWAKADQPAPPPKEIGDAFDRITQHCADCHRNYRDTPLREKQKK
jgi:cytochrome c556